MSNPFAGMFEDDNGGGSSMRFIFVVGSLVVIGVWAYLCIKNDTFVGIPMQDLGILITLILGKDGGKALEAWENRKESK